MRTSTPLRPSCTPCTGRWETWSRRRGHGSTDVAAVLADADAHRARVMAAKLEVYEGAFLDAPARRRPHHRRRRRPGCSAQGLYSLLLQGSFDRARSSAFGETVAAPAVAAEIKRLTAEKAPPREIRARSRRRSGRRPKGGGATLRRRRLGRAVCGAAVAVAAPAAADGQPRARAGTLVPSGSYLRRSHAAVRGSASVEDQAADCARAGGGSQPLGRRRCPSSSSPVSRLAPSPSRYEGGGGGGGGGTCRALRVATAPSQGRRWRGKTGFPPAPV